jgi:hypothetical protein
MNISSDLVLSKSENEMIKGGGWIVVCGDGQSFHTGF